MSVSQSVESLGARAPLSSRYDGSRPESGKSPILTVEPDLDRYYRDFVIGGPGAFMVPATSYETFAEAIIKKLINEIAANDPGALRR